MIPTWQLDTSQTRVSHQPQRSGRSSDWNAAKARIGLPIVNAGNPDIQSLPPWAAEHEAQIRFNPLFAMWPGAVLAIVEIDPLLAYQLTIDKDRSAHHAVPLSNPPQLSELIQVCLPIQPISEQINVFAGPNSLLLKARSAASHRPQRAANEACAQGV
jgi:hypothetical protein